MYDEMTKWQQTKEDCWKDAELFRTRTKFAGMFKLDFRTTRKLTQLKERYISIT